MVGASNPARQYSSVDFPDPDGPITATISPELTLSDTPWRISSWVLPTV